jgi:hypothetical protein
MRILIYHVYNSLESTIPCFFFSFDIIIIAICMLGAIKFINRTVRLEGTSYFDMELSNVLFDVLNTDISMIFSYS